MQATSHILMIRPVQFGYNAQTAVNNAFQVKGGQERVQETALREFDKMVTLLQSHGVDVLIVNDTHEAHTPDSIFPNNWISFHGNGTLVLYPMFAENRRAERKQTVVDAVKDRFQVKELIDLTAFEQDELFLEGTGSMVLDRERRIAYACLSPRTDQHVLQDFCKRLSYTAITFTATDGTGTPIYHTNVMMCVADRYVVICLDSIANEPERAAVSTTIMDSGKKIIAISLSQMNHFAGNMLQVKNNKNESLLVMSSQAYHSLTAEQLKSLEAYNPIVHSPLDTIEKNGGGSARCMIAEIHLPLR